MVFIGSYTIHWSGVIHLRGFRDVKISPLRGVYGYYLPGLVVVKFYSRTENGS